MKMVKYTNKEGDIKEHQYVNEDGKGVYVLVENRKKPVHIPFKKIIGYKEE